MKAPNPIDRINYKLIDTFNRAGNLVTAPTPTLGADWNVLSSNLPSTDILGFLEFGASTGVADYVTHQTPSVDNNIVFDFQFGGVNTPFFINLRSSGGNSFSGTGTSLSIRIKDDGTNFLYRVREQTNSAFNEIVPETGIPGVSLVGTNKFPVHIYDDGANVNLIISDSAPIILSTTFGNTDQFIQFQCALGTLNKLSNLRVY